MSLTQNAAVSLFLVALSSLPAFAAGERAIQIQFISTGPGIDYEAKDAIVEYATRVNQVERALNKMLNKPWGREGEITYCLEFATSEYVRENAELEVRKILSVQIERKPTRYRLLPDCSVPEALSYF